MKNRNEFLEKIAILPKRPPDGATPNPKVRYRNPTANSTPNLSHNIDLSEL